MIEVGKVVLREARDTNWDSCLEESISVSMSSSAILLSIAVQKSANITPEQAITLAQFLLKSAEIQPEYAAATKDLADQQAKLNAKTKDQISGLGLDVEVDIVDSHGTFKVIEA